MIKSLFCRLFCRLFCFLRSLAYKIACYLATRRWLILLPIAVAFALDRASKSWMLTATEKSQTSLPAEPLFDWSVGAFGLSLSLSMNHGVAFGFMRTLGSYSQVPLLFFSSLISLLFVHFALQKRRHVLSALAASLIVGGALGNLYDRIVYKGVLDFIDAHAYSYHWYKFNIADVAITCGAILWLMSELLNIYGKK